MLDRVVAIFAFLVVAGLACKKTADKAASDPAPLGGSAVASGASPVVPQPDPTSPPAPDYSKPALTEDKVQRYIKALAEGGDPFGAATAVGTSATALADQEAFAKKQGFASANEYMDVAGRIMLGEVIVMAADGMAASLALVVKSIADAEKTLADSTTDAVSKAAMAATLDDYKKQLADLEAEAKKAGDLNAEDLALVKKFKTELAAASKASMDALKAKK